MYKGLVLKIKKHYAVVLTKENDYKKIIVKDGLFVGQKILFLEEDIIPVEIRQSVNTMRKKVLALATTAAMVMIMILGSNFMPISTYALISIDINPSLDIRIDKDQNVIEIIPLNDDANNIYNDDMIGTNIFNVIDEMLLNAETLNYLTEENNHILISSANLNDKKDEALSNLITSHLKDNLELHTNVQVLYIESDKETAEDSLDNGVSLGRLEIEKITNNDVKDEKVTEIATHAAVKEKATHFKIKDIDDINELNALIEELSTIENPGTEIITFLESFNDLEDKDLRKLIKDAEKILDDDHKLVNQVKTLAENLLALDTDDQEILNFLDNLDQLIVDNQNNNRELAALKNQANKFLHDFKDKKGELDDLIEELEEYRDSDTLVNQFLDNYEESKDDDSNENNLRNQANAHLLRIQKQELEHSNKGKNDLVKLVKYLNKLEAYREDPIIASFIDITRETIETDRSNIEEFINKAKAHLDDLEDYSNKNEPTHQNNNPADQDFDDHKSDDDKGSDDKGSEDHKSDDDESDDKGYGDHGSDDDKGDDDHESDNNLE